MSSIGEIAEVRALDRGDSVLRLPHQQQAPMTDRVRRLIDAPAFRRLAQISQLGLVGLVYPGARHTRFEHSVGVYRMALLFLRQFARDDQFSHAVSPDQAELFIAAALLHDVAHWPFCHAIEDLQLPSIRDHEYRIEQLIGESELAEHLRRDWAIEPALLAQLLEGRRTDPAGRILYSMLSGPVDVDKLDYLYRDSLHAGVPYGLNFDQQRLLGSLCLKQDRRGIAITDKGKTAAELLVIARYVMFSEVYWHHSVRSGTSMFQRAFVELLPQLDLDRVVRSTEPELISLLSDVAERGANSGVRQLLEGLFGPRRQLYKRLAQYTYFDQPEIYRQLARRPYDWLIDCSRELVERAGHRIGLSLGPMDLLIDAPPAGLEVQVDIDVRLGGGGRFRPLAQLSPVVQALATRQFDDFVKRVRVFAHPRWMEQLLPLEIDALLLEAASATDEGRRVPPRAGNCTT